MVSSAPVAASPCVLLCCQWVCRVILWASCVCADRLLCGAVGTSLLARWVSGVLHGAALPAPVVWRVCRRDEEWWSSAVNGCGLSCGSTSRHSCRRKQKAWKVRLNVVCCILHPGNLLVHTRTPSALATAFNGTNLQPHTTHRSCCCCCSDLAGWLADIASIIVPTLPFCPMAQRSTRPWPWAEWQLQTRRSNTTPSK